MMIAERESITLVAPALRERCVEAAALAERAGHPAIASCSWSIAAPADPPGWFVRAATRGDYRSYWERPSAGNVLIGAGVARLVRSDSTTPLRDVAALLRADRALLVADDLTRELGGVRYLGGFAFDPAQPDAPEWAGFPAGQLVLPRVLLQIRNGQATLTASVPIEPGQDWSAAFEATLTDVAAFDEPSAPATDRHAHILSIEERPTAERWHDIVAHTAAEVRDRRFAKVVLARQQRMSLAESVESAGALRILRERFPNAFVFALATPGGCFVGATPEWLVQLTGREVVTHCLAGTTARGATPEEDARLAEELLGSAKNRQEHAVVVRAISDALDPVCDELLMPDTPQIMAMPNLQHLATPVRARLGGDYCVLDLVERLHPTPAVGGIPRAEALETIREREGFDRGWYAGAIGWVDAAGGGEFAVALRSALLRPEMAILYAGCGIMGDSTPQSEWDETALKFRPMRAALGVES